MKTLSGAAILCLSMVAAASRTVLASNGICFPTNMVIASAERGSHAEDTRQIL